LYFITEATEKFVFIVFAPAIIVPAQFIIIKLAIKVQITTNATAD
jgi:hypothetical protein